MRMVAKGVHRARHLPQPYLASKGGEVGIAIAVEESDDETETEEVETEEGGEERVGAAALSSTAVNKQVLDAPSRRRVILRRANHTDIPTREEQAGRGRRGRASGTDVTLAINGDEAAS